MTDYDTGDKIAIVIFTVFFLVFILTIGGIICGKILGRTLPLQWYWIVAIFFLVWEAFYLLVLHSADKGRQSIERHCAWAKFGSFMLSWIVIWLLLPCALWTFKYLNETLEWLGLVIFCIAMVSGVALIAWIIGYYFWQVNLWVGYKFYPKCRRKKND